MAARLAAIGGWLSGQRYPLLCVALMAAFAVRLPEAAHGGDFWQHSAAVRELATHPAHPRHPQLPIDAPSAFVSPYTLLVAGLSHAIDADAVTALTLMGLVNLALLLVGLRMLLRVLAPDRADAGAFYALLFTLCWWGPDPWMYSGFFHLDALGYVLPYPSTFAAGLTLIALGLNGPGEPRTHRWRAAATVVMAALVLLAHPLTFLFLATGLGAEAATATDGAWRRIGANGMMLAAAVALAAAWPYYPLFTLLTSASRVFDAGNEEMYQDVARRTWPTLALLPLAASSLLARRRRAVALTLGALGALYLFGHLTARLSYGRVISYVVLLLHVEIADAVAGIELDAREWPLARRVTAGAALAATMVWLAWTPLTRLLGPPARDPSYAFLASGTGQYEIVLSDPLTSRVVSTFGGKVVGAETAWAFVPDQEARLADVERFFAADTAPAARAEILGRRDVDHVLLWKREELPWQAIRRELTTWGAVTHEDDTFVLLSRERRPRLRALPRP